MALESCCNEEDMQQEASGTAIVMYGWVLEGREVVAQEQLLNDCDDALDGGDGDSTLYDVLNDG